PGRRSGVRCDGLSQRLQDDAAVARRGLKPGMRERNKLVPFRRDRDERRAALRDGVLDAQRDDLVRLLEVDAGGDDRLRALDLGVDRGAALDAERIAQRTLDGTV